MRIELLAILQFSNLAEPLPLVASRRSRLCARGSPGDPRNSLFRSAARIDCQIVQVISARRLKGNSLQHYKDTSFYVTAVSILREARLNEKNSKAAHRSEG